MHALGRPFCPQQVPGEQQGTGGNRAVGDIEYRPNAQIDKINNVPYENPVDQITDRTRQYQAQRKPVGDRQGMPASVEVRVNIKDSDQRNNDKQQHLPREYAEGSAAVVG